MSDLTQSKGYFPEIDGLRAIAVIAVVLYHYSFIPFFKGGFTGVDVFFVISGFVISKSLYTSPYKNPYDYFSSFYKRRILRIAPALIFCLLVSILAATLFIPSNWHTNMLFDTAKAAFAGISNFILVFRNDGYFAPRSEFNPFLHTWSLAVEEQFYVIFPILFYFWLQNSNKKSFSGYISQFLLPVIAASSLVYCAIKTHTEVQKAFYLLPARFWELASGAILFQLYVKNKIRLTRKSTNCFVMAAGIILVSAGFIYSGISMFPFPMAFLPVIGTVLLIIGITNNRSGHSFFHSMLRSPFAVYIGKTSYSIYLWHWPVAVLFKWTVGFNTLVLKTVSLVIAVVLALLSYHLIESPVRKNRFLRKQPSFKIIFAGIAIIVTSFGLGKIISDSKELISLSVTKNNYIWHSWDFRRDKPKKSVTPDQRIEGRKIFAIGDSHTAAYRTMLNIVTTHMGIEYVEFEKGGCAVAGLQQPMDDECASHYKQMIKEVSQLSQPGDIVFLASLRMPELGDRNEAIDTDAVLESYFSDSSDKNRTTALEEAEKIINDFEDLGVYVLFEAPLPVLKAPPFLCSDWFNRTNPIAANGLTIERSLLTRIRKPVMDSIEILQSSHPDMYVWDPFPVLVKEKIFSAYDKEGLPIFYDGDHLSGHGNRLLAPSFRNAVENIWLNE